MRSSALPPAGILMIDVAAAARSACGRPPTASPAVPGVDGIGIAASVQQEVLVLHVGEAFGIEGHADEVEVRVEAVDLQRIFDVVLRRAVAVVVGVQLVRPAVRELLLVVHRLSPPAGSGLLQRMSRRRVAGRAQIASAAPASAGTESWSDGTRFCRGRT